ncbi:uncharacterized protein [Rutidosis leptorrhynchoides]|uniref:uncharacterized protein n=1 Tax=Rutidosis leptorrhynchoides TaxID=125765 RepID=UPI003A9A1B9A
METPVSSFLIALILIIGTTSTVPVNGIQLPGGIDVNSIAVVGRIVCNISDTVCLSPTIGEGIAGVNAFVSCNGGKSSLGQATSDTRGFISIIFATGDGALFDYSNCSVYVPLPVGNCTVFPPTGIAYSLLNPVGFVQTLLGNSTGILTFGNFKLSG